MIKKGLLFATILLAAIVFMFTVFAKYASAAKQVPVEFKLERKYNQTDDQIKAMLKAGWQLGGIYRECGEGFGEVEVTEDVNGALLPLYEKTLAKTKKEILDLLKKTNTPSRSADILDKIVDGQDRLTNYGSLPEYQALQDRFDKINSIIADLKTAPKKEKASPQSMVERLEKFTGSGSTLDVNPAMRAVKSLAKTLEKNPDSIVEPGKTSEEDLAVLERVRKAMQDSLKVAEKLGGGCRMAYVYYRKE